MSYRIMNHEMRMEIRSQIIQACTRNNLPVDFGMVENLTNRRIQNIGREMAVGESKPVDWDKMVLDEHKTWTEGREKLQEFAMKAEARMSLLPEDKE